MTGEGIRRPATAHSRRARASAAPRQATASARSPPKPIGPPTTANTAATATATLAPDRQDQRRHAWRRAGSSPWTIPPACRPRRWSWMASCTSPAPTSASRSTPAAAGQIWHYQRPRSKGLVGNASGGINRGVAVEGDRVFMVTDNAHLLAFNRFTGAVLWETEMADSRQNYSATAAPIAAERPDRVRDRGRRRGRARIRRSLRPGDRQGALALLDHSPARRAGLGNLEGEDHRASRRRHLDDRQLRPATGPALLAHRQPRLRHERRRAARRQPVHLLRGGARRQDRQAPMALPVHAARRLGLGRAAAAGAGGRGVGGPAAQTAAGCQSQRLLLRARPDRRKAAAAPNRS